MKLPLPQADLRPRISGLLVWVWGKFSQWGPGAKGPPESEEFV